MQIHFRGNFSLSYVAELLNLMKWGTIRIPYMGQGTKIVLKLAKRNKLINNNDDVVILDLKGN